MSISEIRNELQTLIDSDDEKLLRMFYAMAGAYKSQSEATYPSLSEEEFL